MSRYIDVDKLNKFEYDLFDGPLTEDAVQGMDTVFNFINNIPTEDVKPVVHGEWIKDEECRWKCSVCGEQNKFAYAMADHSYEIVQQDYYCPHCGADLRGDKE